MSQESAQGLVSLEEMYTGDFLSLARLSLQAWKALVFIHNTAFLMPGLLGKISTMM